MFGLSFLRKKPDVIAPLFADIVAAARHPVAYRDLGVTDDFEGRFERLALVMVLVLRRLNALNAPADSVGQELVDRLFAHLDDGLRRSGVGDLSVGKKMKKLAQAFYGRAKAYTEALDGADEPALRDALARNLFGSSVQADDVPSGLLAEIRDLTAALEASDLAALLAGARLETAISRVHEGSAA
ncbi:MAG: ubiquinol-cytochrome C chaperone [Rhizobiales bacterium]|nr:ubiquinol-cytochrome C chaperone [Hyphomicrobiales bacterium]